jgi:hypothetical protein
MAAAVEQAVLVLPVDYDEQSAFETPSRGYLSGASVRFADGRSYAVFFIDPVRLQQDLEGEAKWGRPYFAEPNLIVLPEVTEQAMRTAVEELAKNGFFQHLKPLT